MLRHIKKLAVLSVVVVAIGFAMPASAGLLVDPGTTAMPGWFGTTSIFSAMFYFDAGVEFAVYYPGTFDTQHGAGADPSGGTEFVYAYQFFDYHPLALKKVSIGLDADEPFTGPPLGNVGFLSDLGVAPAPHSGEFAVDMFSVRWDFLSPMIGQGQKSDILIYTCPTLPEWGNVAVQNSYGLQHTVLGSVPNLSLDFIPEPGTLALLSVGALGLLRRRRTVR